MNIKKFTISCFAGAVALFSAIGATATEVGIVNCDLLNVRVSPNTECDIINRLSTGSRFEIIYTDNGWYNIKMANGVTGFVSAQYVTRYNSDNSEASNIAATIAQNAYNYLGYTYSYGASGPNAFDCSGFTSYLYKQQGISIPRTADNQSEAGVYVNKSELLPGDLVFFSNRSDRSVNHVGVYVGNGEFIHASTSTRGVVKDSLSSNYYTNHYVTARRML